MVSLGLGVKRQCQECGTKFFDLNRDPINCPKCGVVFQKASTRGGYASNTIDDNEDSSEKRDGVDLVSLEDIRDSEQKLDIIDSDIDEDGNDDEDDFLEEEDGDDDVSSLIDGDIVIDEEP